MTKRAYVAAAAAAAAAAAGDCCSGAGQDRGQGKVGSGGRWGMALPLERQLLLCLWLCLWLWLWL